MSKMVQKSLYLDAISGKRLETITNKLKDDLDKNPEIMADISFSAVVRYCINKAFKEGQEKKLW